MRPANARESRKLTIPTSPKVGCCIDLSIDTLSHPWTQSHAHFDQNVFFIAHFLFAKAVC